MFAPVSAGFFPLAFYPEDGLISSSETSGSIPIKWHYVPEGPINKDTQCLSGFEHSTSEFSVDGT
jgi:hypothetical protein